MKPPRTFREPRFKFRLDGKSERKSSEVENENLLFRVKNTGMRGAERRVDLFDRRRDGRSRRRRNVKVITAIPERASEREDNEKKEKPF